MDSSVLGITWFQDSVCATRNSTNPNLPLSLIIQMISNVIRWSSANLVCDVKILQFSASSALSHSELSRVWLEEGHFNRLLSTFTGPEFGASFFLQISWENPYFKSAHEPSWFAISLVSFYLSFEITCPSSKRALGGDMKKKVTDRLKQCMKDHEGNLKTRFSFSQRFQFKACTQALSESEDRLREELKRRS